MPKVDIAKRRRVMQRSQKLGHCICDPRRPCPCQVFTDQGICPCAGERPEPLEVSKVRLTQLVHNTGCASKIAPADLEAVLGSLPAVNDPAVLSGIPAADDAAIYRLNDGTLIVQTVDVMTPCVDDPYLFGRICATNCLSDIYAMGGTPRTALSILAFPSETLDGQIMCQMMKGASDVLGENGCSLIGGHSIKDDEIKLGFAITGTVEQADALRHDTARPGDLLVLTKPLGIGVVNFAVQVGRGGVDVAAAERWMAQSNKPAAEAARSAGASACTDVTGFGLLGHLLSMLRHSGVSARIDASALPAIDGVVAALRDGVVSGAIERNMEYVGDALQADGVEPALVQLALDAQTSGGLLIAIARQRHEGLLRELSARDVPAHTIGQIMPEENAAIILQPGALPLRDVGPEACCAQAGDAPPPSRGQDMKQNEKTGHSENCCADVFGASTAGQAEHGHASSVTMPSGQPTTAGASLQAFGALMRSTATAGAIDEKSKELLLFALVVHSRCGPCFAHHYERALKMGITQQQLDEAAWCAVAMGGAPVKMFYEEALEAAKTRPSGP